MLEPEALGQHKDDLAVMLRDLCKRAGLTGERLAARCAMSQSKISKIETGKIIPSVVDVERILQALNAPSHVLADVTTLAKLANTEFHDVRSLLRKGLEKKQHELTGMEIVTTDFMALQLDRLASLAYLPNIQLGVIPVTERPPRSPLNTFTVTTSGWSPPRLLLVRSSCVTLVTWPSTSTCSAASRTSHYSATRPGNAWLNGQQFFVTELMQEQESS